VSFTVCQSQPISRATSLTVLALRPTWASPIARIGPSSPSSGADAVVLLGPAAGSALVIGAGEAALVPDEPRPTAEARQVEERDNGPFLETRRDPTGLAEHAPTTALDVNEQLAIDDFVNPEHDHIGRPTSSSSARVASTSTGALHICWR